MRWLVLSIVMGGGLGLAGCQPAYWYQEGKTFDECKADRADCRAELLRRTDLNYVSSYEERFTADCMRRRGYRLVSSEDLPLDVKREEPNVATAVPWNRFYGVAGTIDERSESDIGTVSEKKAPKPKLGRLVSAQP
ncbi:MAG: hypothetical protein ABFE01_22220 [Phycisphaerales bacterium]|jgi:hypothetical protein